MRSQWVIWLLVSGVAYVSGSPCDSGPATICYADLLHYESLAFPLYGEDEAGLDYTCENINVSFECIQNYTETCHNNPECDAQCRELIREAHAFTLNTGLRNLATELCSASSPLRETYLENYHCLERNADAYSACHNDSQMSLEYLNTIVDFTVIPLRCCYFGWYRDCFENVTRDNCGVNATFYVSFAMRKLVGHIADQLCQEIDSSCERPPLPASEDEDELDKEKPNMTNDGVDNSINKHPKDSATVTNHSVVVLVLSYCFVLLSKRFLCIND